MVKAKGDKWVWVIRPGVQRTFDTKAEAEKAAGISASEELPTIEVEEIDEELEESED